MEDRKVPYLIHEGTMARFERVNKWLVISLIISILLLFLSNIAWLYVWQSYDYESAQDTITVDAGYGTANYVGNDGDIINGEDYSKSYHEDTEEK